MLPVCRGRIIASVMKYNITSSVIKYNITSGERSNLPNLPKHLASHACAIVNNTIIVSGGHDNLSSTNQVWKLELQAYEWKPLPSLQLERYSSFSS